MQSDVDCTTKPSTKEYRHECLQMLERAAPELFAMPADKVTQAACAEIAKRLADRYSATRFNGILTVLRALFDLAVKRGWCHQNPASPIKEGPVVCTVARISHQLLMSSDRSPSQFT